MAVKQKIKIKTFKTQISKKLSIELILTMRDKKLQFLDKDLDKDILGFIAEYNF